MADYTFMQFLQDQINEKADGSQRAFSRMSGIAHTTIGRLLDKTKDNRPELDTLGKLSVVTNTNLITLIHLAYPEGFDSNISPTAQVVAEQFDKLPDELKSAIVAMMRGAMAKG